MDNNWLNNTTKATTLTLRYLIWTSNVDVYYLNTRDGMALITTVSVFVWFWSRIYLSSEFPQKLSILHGINKTNQNKGNLNLTCLTATWALANTTSSHPPSPEQCWSKTRFSSGIIWYIFFYLNFREYFTEIHVNLWITERGGVGWGWGRNGGFWPKYSSWAHPSPNDSGLVNILIAKDTFLQRIGKMLFLLISGKYLFRCKYLMSSLGNSNTN